MKTIRIFFIVLFIITVRTDGQAQLCLHPTDSVYGLNSITGSGSGQIVGVNVNTAGAAAIGSPASSSANANGLGFSQITGLFYFFNQTGSGTTEFVAYNPLTGIKTARAIPSSPALPTATTGKIRSGTVTKNGAGYYMIFPGATTAMGYASTAPAFYYFNIGANSWTLITQSFKDVSNATVTAIQSLNSGDMAFDGNNNLWLLASSSTQYALYRINASLPTTAVAKVTVDVIVPVTSNPISGVSFTGIAFNSAGKMYLSTGSCTSPPCTAGYNKLYEMATPGVLTLKGTLPVNGYGDDLSSCVYPVGVLPVTWVNFTAALQNNNSIKLSWKVNEDDNVSGYNIEYSRDSEHWQTIDHVRANNSAPGALEMYEYNHKGYNTGVNYYRIVAISSSGQRSISAVKPVNTKMGNKMYIGPNPVKDVITFYNKDISTKSMVQVFDQRGVLAYSTTLERDQQSINVGQLPRGNYILKLLLPSSAANNSLESFQFIKW